MTSLDDTAPLPPVAIPVVQLPHGGGLPLPAYETVGAAGMDLLAAIDEDVPIPLMERVLIPTGLTIALPPGWEAQVRPRSGLALNYAVTVLNAPGTIDADYRGEIKVLLINLGKEIVTIRRGMRIAQLVVAPVAQATWQRVAVLPSTDRGSGGFGSTGTQAPAQPAAPPPPPPLPGNALRTFGRKDGGV
jgi:dUTP pyrophosphatase